MIRRPRLFQMNDGTFQSVINGEIPLRGTTEEA